MRLIVIFLFNFLVALSALAQENHQDRHKRIEALKATFITQKLNLTPEEAQNFWPVYNQYQSELGDLYRKKRQNQQAKKNNPDQALNNDLDLETKIVNTKKKYYKEFSRILPSEKVLALTQAEREFREQLIKELRERRKENN